MKDLSCYFAGGDSTASLIELLMKRKFFSMSMILTDPEQWCDAYDQVSVKQRYEMLMEVFNQPLSPQLIQDVDLGTILVEMRDELDSNNLIELFLAFVTKFQQQQPQLYQEEYPYFDNLLVEYYLFRNDLAQVRTSLTRSIADSVSGIDFVLDVLEQLKFYGTTEIAVDLCRATYHNVQKSPQVLGGTETELADTVLMSLIEQAYQQLKNDIPFDGENLRTTATEYYSQNTSEFEQEILGNLTAVIENNQDLTIDLKRNFEKDLRTLSMAFSVYMIEKKQVNFITSQTIWTVVFYFLEDRNLPRKNLTNPDKYFTFNQQALDKYIGKLFGGLVSVRQAEAVGILWGIPYVYDFLFNKRVIGEKVYQQAIAITTALKVSLIQVLGRSLWKYDFVHRWQPPDSISAADFAAEAEIFAASINNVKPLSEEPGEGTIESFYSQLSSELDNTLLKQPAPTPKQRKNPLQEAAELYDRELKKSKKKNQK